MKTFREFMQTNQPNMGPGANPANPQQIMPTQKQHAASDANFIHLKNTYDRMSRQHTNDPNVESLGQALQQAEKSGNMTVLQPFVNMYINPVGPLQQKAAQRQQPMQQQNMMQQPMN